LNLSKCEETEEQRNRGTGEQRNRGRIIFSFLLSPELLNS